MTMIFPKLLRSFGLVLFLVANFTAHPALAAKSKWQDLGGGEGRLIASVDPVSQQIEGVIEIRLDQGWSTYWRYPGSSGIPPRFDFSRSNNITISKVDFPSPQLLVSNGVTYAGYKKRVLFPFKGTMGENGTPALRLNLLIGICDEICIPAVADFEIERSALMQSNPQSDSLIELAKLSIPKVINASENRLEMNHRSRDELEITIHGASNLQNPVLFAEGPPEWNLVPPKLVGREEQSLHFVLDVSRVKTEEPDFYKLTFTLVSGTTGIEFRH